MDVLEAALLGSAREGPRPELAAELHRHGIAPPAEPEYVLLAAAALASKLARAGYQPATFPGELPGAAPPDDRPEVGPEAADCLRQILGAKQKKELLQEFCAVVVQRGKRAPSAFLPDLLDWAAEHPQALGDLHLLMGKRGPWLAQRNPVWAAQFEAPDENSWALGSPDTRKTYLQRLRATQPQKALEHLQATWKSESLDQKADFLSLLKENLSLSDEPFLESLLDERSKELRKTAAQYLALLPGSALGERMFRRVSKLIQIGGNFLKGKKLLVELPSEPDADALRDGLNPKEQWPLCGPKSTLLGQMVAATPPARWAEHLKTDPAGLCALALKHEHGPALLTAWAKASVPFRDDEWKMALIECRAAHAEKEIWHDLNLRFLFPHLSQQSHNQLALKLLHQSGGSNLSDDQPVVQLLLELKPWTTPLALLVLQRIRKVIENDSYVYHWGLKSLLKRAALAVPPELAELTATGWPEDSRNWRSWQLDVEEFSRTLALRHKMMQSI